MASCRKCGHYFPDFVFDDTGRCGGCRLEVQRRWDHRRERTRPTGDAWAEVRAQRNALLAACDWTQLPDVPDAIRAQYAGYRQALRDITADVASPSDVRFPAIPCFTRRSES